MLIAKKPLNDAIAHLDRLIPSRSANTSLTMLKISAKDGGVHLSGTNLEVDLEVSLAADINEDYEIVVPAQLFSQIVRNLPGDEAELQIGGPEVLVSSGGANFKLQTGDLNSYPELYFADEFDLELDAKELARSITAVRYAAAVEEFRQVFRGIQFEFSPDKSRIVATDAFRLALRDFPGSTMLTRKLVVPARSADEMVKILKDGSAKLAIGQTSLTLATDRARLNVKLMEGELPDYERVIPQNGSVQIEIEAARLREAVARVAVVLDKSVNKVDFFVAENCLQLKAESEFGQAQDKVAVKQDGAEPAISLAFRAKQIIEALGPIDGIATIDLNSNAPSVFRSVNDPGYLAIVNPLRV